MTTSQLDRIEWKLDQLLAHCLRLQDMGGGASKDVAASPPHHPTEYILSKFTTKQHAVLQMLLAGCSNEEIAQRFGVSPNTAKVYVRTIAGKLGVNTRAQIVMKTLEEFNSVSEQSYLLVSDGLPKTWHEDWSEPDPFAHKLRKKGEP